MKRLALALCLLATPTFAAGEILTTPPPPPPVPATIAISIPTRLCGNAVTALNATDPVGIWGGHDQAQTLSQLCAEAVQRAQQAQQAKQAAAAKK